MEFKDDKDDFFDGPDLQDVPKPEKLPRLKPEDPDYWEQEESEFEHLVPKRRSKLWLWASLAIVAIGVVLFVWLRWFSPYVSEAMQYGYVESIEKRGTIFKTYEGTLIPYKEKLEMDKEQSAGVTSVDSIAAQDSTQLRGSFVFSVNDSKVATQLRRLQYANLPVRVEYRRYHGTLPWRGDSKIVIIKADTADASKILPPRL